MLQRPELDLVFQSKILEDCRTMGRMNSVVHGEVYCFIYALQMYLENRDRRFPVSPVTLVRVTGDTGNRGRVTWTVRVRGVFCTHIITNDLTILTLTCSSSMDPHVEEKKDKSTK